MFGGPRTAREDLFADSSSPVLTICVLCTEQHCSTNVRGRLGGSVAVGNTFQPGETGRRCMFISRGGATRGLAGVQYGKRRGPQCGVCVPTMHRHNNISRKKQAMAKLTAENCQAQRSARMPCVRTSAQLPQIRQERSELLDAMQGCV